MNALDGGGEHTGVALWGTRTCAVGTRAELAGLRTRRGTSSRWGMAGAGSRRGAADRTRRRYFGEHVRTAEREREGEIDTGGFVRSLRSS